MDEYRTIPVSGRRGAGLYIKVDAEDYAEVTRSTWSLGTHGYARARRNQQTVFLHKLLCPGDGYVDHINHDRLDNRRANLRLVDNATNVQNRQGAQRNSKSGVRNVCWHKKSGKWLVQLSVRGRYVYVGLYDDLGDAARAASTARQEHFGQN